MGKTHDDDEVEIDLRELYYALKKRVLVILAAVLAGAVIAGAATKLLMTPVYSATSTMLVLTMERIRVSLGFSIVIHSINSLYVISRFSSSTTSCNTVRLVLTKETTLSSV